MKTEFTDETKPFRFAYDVNNQSFQVHGSPKNLKMDLDDASEELKTAGKAFIKAMSVEFGLTTDDGSTVSEDLDAEIDEAFVKPVVEEIKEPEPEPEEL